MTTPINQIKAIENTIAVIRASIWLAGMIMAPYEEWSKETKD